ncbi:hypothetical protein LTR41_011082 [Exophiala xenobiotica]|nr:hypothetical protein LTR41_011082 [Exophiala xenobiotica]KAK5444806.1 hypothetical protein LTR18_004511 [Exophiala xenobiotica]KAK5551096.1 hypothetical protein LTR46_010914 [Exophiala xenobiotica]
MAFLKGYWRRLSQRQLLLLTGFVAAFAVGFDGMAQGAMASVQAAPHYTYAMQLGTIDGVVTHATRQGGIVAIYYLGSLCGAFLAGHIADKYGRSKAVYFGAAWAFLGCALECAAQNLNMMLCARIIAGMGAGQLMSTVPTWTAEIAASHHRGKVITATFMANFVGIALIVWLGFGISFTSFGDGSFRWRFVFAANMLPLFILIPLTMMMPESPRWLVKVGRREEALEILALARGEGAHTTKVQHEVNEIIVADELEKESGTHNSYWSMLVGVGYGDLHIARRVQLGFWLQVMCQFCTGIAAVLIYSGYIFALANFNGIKSSWLGAITNTVGIPATLVAIYSMDVLGRRKLAFVGSTLQTLLLFLIGGLMVAIKNNPENANNLGKATASLIPVYMFVFAATWLVIPWVYATEIFPTALRARGNGFNVAGWSIGYGGGGLVIPIMFQNIGANTFFVIGAFQIITIPIIYCFYPETNQRSLESLDLLFASKSPFVWAEEREFAKRINELEHAVEARMARDGMAQSGAEKDLVHTVQVEKLPSETPSLDAEKAV